MIDQLRQPVAEVANGRTNALPPFTPHIEIQPADTIRKPVPQSAGHSPKRQAPLLLANTPWNSRDVLEIEVPEYTWASVPGEANAGAPFFYGRPFNTKTWPIRYHPLTPPAWERRADGSLALDAALEGGYVQRFRVVPRDRMFEVWFGVTNGSAKPLENLRAQLCLMPHRVAGLEGREPTTTRLFSEGKVVSWDGAGQDLSWLDAHREASPELFQHSCYFISPLKGYEHPGWPENARERDDLMWLKRPVDLPAIAKQDPARPRRNLIVYSPFGRDAFYNVLIPCFHADPHMDAIAPGQTRWTVSFFIYYEGDLNEFFRALMPIHQQLARREGIAKAP